MYFDTDAVFIDRKDQNSQDYDEDDGNGSSNSCFIGRKCEN